MAIEKDNAILLRRMDFRNTSQIVTLLSEEHGVLPAIAKGSRRPNNPMYGHLDYFNQGELVYYEKTEGQLHIASQFEPVHEPILLRRSHYRFTAAIFMAEVILNCCRPGESLTSVYHLLARSLNSLESEHRPLLVVSHFCVFFLQENGLGPVLFHCIDCHKPLDGKQASLDALKGGCLCTECGSGPAVEPAVLSALRYICKAQGDLQSFRFPLKLATVQGLALLKTVCGLIQAQLEIRLHTLPGMLNALIREEEISYG